MKVLFIVIGGDVTTDLHDINGDLENQIGVHHHQHHHHGDTLFNDNYNGSDGRGDHNKNSNSVTETTPLIDNTKNGVASVLLLLHVNGNQ